MGNSAWAASHVNTRFAGCEVMGRLPLPAVGDSKKENFAFIFRLTHDQAARVDGRPVGAWYRDGACMIWPRAWLDKSKLVEATEDELDMIDAERIRLSKLDRERRAFWRVKYGELEFDGTHAGAKFLGVNKGPIRVLKRIRKKSAGNIDRVSKRIRREN